MSAKNTLSKNNHTAFGLQTYASSKMKAEDANKFTIATSSFL